MGTVAYKYALISANVAGRLFLLLVNFQPLMDSLRVRYYTETHGFKSVVRSNIDLCLGSREDFPSSLQFATAEG